MVGLLVYDILDPYCAPIIKQIEAELIPHRYTLLISDVGYDRNRCRVALDTLTERRVDGIICVANQLPFDMVELRQAVGSTPMVLIGRRSREARIPYFVVNEELGGYMQAHYLIAAGHRDIAFIWDDGRCEWSELRRKGVVKAMQEAGLNPNFLVRTHDSSSDAGYQATRRLREMKLPFTAVCAIDDQCAFGVIRELVDAGLRVPEDVSVIGFDDLTISRYYNPTLTTIAQPLDKLGQLATEALLKFMNGRGKVVNSRTLRPALVERRSTQNYSQPARAC